jgi:hypothetical protein
MDINSPEPAKMDDRAIRVRTLIVIIAAVLVGAPFVMYLIFGSGLVPTR